MEKINKFRSAIVILLFGLVCSCKEDHLITYDKDDSIYFVQPYRLVYTGDSLSLSLGYIPTSVTDTVVKFLVKATGAPTATDRPIKINVNPDAPEEEGKYYSITSQPVMHAGRILDTVSIKLLRDPSLKVKEHMIRIQLGENDFFNTAISSQRLSYRLFISDIAAMPKWWSTSYFGVFSIKKLMLMIELTGIDAASNTGLSAENGRYYGLYVQRYLNGMVALGTPIYEDNGTLMVMGKDVQ